MSNFSKSQFVAQVQEDRRNAIDFWHNWRTEARDAYAFVAGKQWTDEDEEKLKRQKRPPITFNYSEKMIDAVVGAEVSNRNELVFKPRSEDDFASAELWTEAARTVRANCNAEFEEGDAFRDMLITGLGWTETKVSYDSNHDGDIEKSRIDPLEMWVDPAACKLGLADRRFQFREWYVDEKEAKREWGGNQSFLATREDPAAAAGVIVRNLRYADSEKETDNHKGQVLITCYECAVREPVYRAAIGGKVMEIPQKDFQDMQEHLDEAKILYVRQYKMRYYRGYFSGDKLLEWGLSPAQDGFLYNVITGKRDRNKNTWYGLVRVMMDPQRWANKWLSQILHIINSNAKGGLLAEVNAFVDPKKAADEWSSPDSITWLREGSLSGKKIQERSVVNYPAGLDKLMQFALGSLPMVTGINLEALGLANREQAGVLEQQRKQAAYGLLAPLFDGLRMYRINEGRVLFNLMNEYIADGRLIRIGGPGAEQYVQLAKREGTLKFDLIVDVSPNAPDVKERTWSALENLVPALIKAGMAVPPDVLDYAPIPTSLSQKWKAYIQQMQQQAAQQSPQMQQMQEQMQELQQENQQLQADHTAEMQKVQAEIQVMYAKLGLEREKVQATVQIKQQESQTKNQILQQQGQQQLAQNSDQHAQEMELQQQQAEQQLEMQQESGAQKNELAQQSVDNQHKVAMTKARSKPTPKPKLKG